MYIFYLLIRINTRVLINRSHFGWDGDGDKGAQHTHTQHYFAHKFISKGWYIKRISRTPSKACVCVSFYILIYIHLYVYTMY